MCFQCMKKTPDNRFEFGTKLLQYGNSKKENLANKFQIEKIFNLNKKI